MTVNHCIKLLVRTVVSEKDNNCIPGNIQFIQQIEQSACILVQVFDHIREEFLIPMKNTGSDTFRHGLILAVWCGKPWKMR
jgi:hypothetical protein